MRALRLTLAVACLLFSQTARAQEGQVFVFGGPFISNAWNDLYRAPGTIEGTGDGILGIGYAREWALGTGGFSVGLEGQLSYHFGRQYYVELAVPATIRYAPQRSGVFRSFAYGLGFSTTSATPELEVEKGGSSQRTLFHWFLEAELGQKSSPMSALFRLHHRSNGFDTFDEPGSSNYLVLGLRRRF
jgi:hypothetical protein